MQINKAKFERVVEEAKSRTNDKRWLRAIDRAAQGILSGELIVTTLAHGALVTSPNGSYMANGDCQCKAAARGHKECRHRAAARLIELYEEKTAHAAVSPAPENAGALKNGNRQNRQKPADERAGLVAEIKSIWPRFAPGLPLATELTARFGKNKLEMLDTDMLRRVRLVVAL